jgi:hypothetical protein
MPFLHAYRRCLSVLANTHVWSTRACVLALRGSQVLCLAEQVYFTRQAEEILKGDHAAAPGSLRALRERLMGQLTAYTAHDLSSEPLLQVGVNTRKSRDRGRWSMPVGSLCRSRVEGPF